MTTRGTRVGTYWRDGRNGSWYAMTPDGRLAGLANHTVIEHDDRTITVSPSILTSGGEAGGSWHGFLDRGVWREC